MIISAKTSVGKVRFNNEDAFYISPDNGDCPKLFMVADGMGGHRSGEVASQMAVKEVSDYINAHYRKNLSDDMIKTIIKDSMVKANQKVLESSASNEELKGMGTTLTLALFFGKKFFIGHVGDSRAYRIRGNEIVQLTRDHSLVWELMEQGKLTMEETRTHPMKNLITKALGTDELLEPDIMEFYFIKDDIIILCSDGLTNMLEDSEIKEIVCRNEIEKAADVLIETANLYGGIDNITVELIRVD